MTPPSYKMRGFSYINSFKNCTSLMFIFKTNKHQPTSKTANQPKVSKYQLCVKGHSSLVK